VVITERAAFEFVRDADPAHRRLRDLARPASAPPDAAARS
jgi:hypothetical protein